MAHPPDQSFSVFNFLDYREFLRMCIQERKRVNRAFSIRYVAGKVGIDHGSLTRVMQGKRSLDARLSASLAKVLGLAGEETDFFETLVLFGQARSQAEKHQFLERLVRLSGSKIKSLEARQSSFYRDWRHQAMRELLNFFPCDGDFARLGRMLQPPVSEEAARESVNLLLDLGLVAKDDLGRYILTEHLITSGRNLPMEILDETYKSMGTLAINAVDEVSPKERSFSGLTLSLSPAGLESIRGKLRLFRREILEVARLAQSVDRVYQMNFQVFPLSRRYDGGPG